MKFAQGTDFSPGSSASAQLNAFTNRSRGNKPGGDMFAGGTPGFYDNDQNQSGPIKLPEPPKAQPAPEAPVVSQPVAAPTPAATPKPRMAGQQLQANTPAKPKADVQAQPVVTPRQEAELQLEQAAASGGNAEQAKGRLENIIKQEIAVKSDAVEMEFIRRCGNERGNPCVKPGPGGRPAFDYQMFRNQLNGVREQPRKRPQAQQSSGPRIQPVEDGPSAMPQFPDANRRNNEKPIDNSRREPIWKQLQSRYVNRQTSRKDSYSNRIPAEDTAQMINNIRLGQDRPIVSRSR
jgi:hypothetical protein